MTRYRDDAQELADKVTDRIEDVLSEYWSGWVTAPAPRRSGATYALVTPRIKDKSKKQTSSFTVELSGSDRGKWYRFSRAVGGHSLQLLYYGHRDRLPVGKEDWADCYQLAREFLGIERQPEASAEEVEERARRRIAEDAEREVRERERRAEVAIIRAERALTAQDLLLETIPLIGTLGDAYLQERGLPPVAEWGWDPGQTIRFHPNHRYELDYSLGAFPTIVANVQDAWGDTVAAWRIYLNRQRPEKAPVEHPKVGLGPAAGGAVRIGGDHETVGGGEGLETSLAAWFLIDRKYPVWACLSTSGLVAWEPPPFVKKSPIFPDGDKGILNKKSGLIFDPPGMVAARARKERLEPAGIPSPIQDMCLLGDALDLLNTKRKYEERT